MAPKNPLLFKPRSVTNGANAQNYGQAPGTTAPPGYPAASAPYGAPPAPTFAGANQYYGQQTHAQQSGYHNTGYSGYGGQNGPAQGQTPFQNPFNNPDPQDPAAAATGAGTGWGDYDAEAEAQIAQWQSAYGNPNSTKQTYGGSPASQEEKQKAPATDSEGNKLTIVRKGGGKTWTDPGLLDWDPNHYRLFIGNLAGEVTDDSLKKGFNHYSSVSKTRVVRDKVTSKSKGYGFVAFANADEYFRAAREMNGKYIGSHPVMIKKAKVLPRPISQKRKEEDKGNGKKNGKKGEEEDHAGGHANTGAGVIRKKKKDQPKTINGLKLLG